MSLLENSEPFMYSTNNNDSEIMISYNLTHSSTDNINTDIIHTEHADLLVLTCQV
jgi:hypothetical protein